MFIFNNTNNNRNSFIFFLKSHGNLMSLWTGRQAAEKRMKKKREGLIFKRLTFILHDISHTETHRHMETWVLHLVIQRKCLCWEQFRIFLYRD